MGEYLDQVSDWELYDRRWNAAAAFSEATLWADRPAARAEELTPEAWDLQVQRAEAARRAWFAIDLELETRRRINRTSRIVTQRTGT